MSPVNLENDQCIKTFGIRLKMLREKAKLSQSELAKVLKVSRGAISFYENGERGASIDFLHRTADFFDVSLNYLLGYDESLRPILQNDLSFLSDSAVEALKEHSHNAEILNMLITESGLRKLIKAFFDLMDCERYRLKQKGIYPTVTGKAAVEDLAQAHYFDRKYAIFRITSDFVSSLDNIAVSYIYKSLSEKELETPNKSYEQIMKKYEESRNQSIELTEKYIAKYKESTERKARMAVHEFEDGD